MKMFNWLKVSNRTSHLYVGFALWVLLMLLGIGILSLFEQVTDFSDIQGTAITMVCAILSDVAVFVAMCAVEYTQKYSGVGKWDWLDVLAGCLAPVIITVAITIIYII